MHTLVEDSMIPISIERSGCSAAKTSVRHREPSRSSKLSVPRHCIAQLPLPFRYNMDGKCKPFSLAPCTPRPKTTMRLTDIVGVVRKIQSFGFGTPARIKADADAAMLR